MRSTRMLLFFFALCPAHLIGFCSSFLPSVQLTSKSSRPPRPGRAPLLTPNAGPPRCAPGRAPPLTPKFNQGPRVPASALLPGPRTPADPKRGASCSSYPLLLFPCPWHTFAVKTCQNCPAGREQVSKKEKDAQTHAGALTLFLENGGQRWRHALNCFSLPAAC